MTIIDELHELRDKVNELTQLIALHQQREAEIRILHEPLVREYPTGTTTICTECRYDGMHAIYPCPTIVRLNRGFSS